ncbi:MAG: hypothetical protein H0W84_14065 [Bacteroidetes bacterium]|nr:hypothetical protein [Bacteroidota bacterium]
MANVFINKKLLGIKKILFLCFILAVSVSQAQVPNPYRQGKIKHRISGGTVLSYYKNNLQHTINTKAKPGFCFSYKSEIILSKKTNALAGFEYFNHGLSFNSYFVSPGHTYLFDETYSYKHELRIQEIQIPIGIKTSFSVEKDNLYSPYFFAGVGARYIISSYALITNDSTGNAVYDDKVKTGFEYQFIMKGLNTFLFGGLGIQTNFRKTGGAAFFEMTYKYGISRLHYSGHQYSNNLNIKDAHLAFTIGFRF